MTLVTVKQAGCRKPKTYHIDAQPVYGTDNFNADISNFVSNTITSIKKRVNELFVPAALEIKPVFGGTTSKHGTGVTTLTPTKKLTPQGEHWSHWKHERTSCNEGNCKKKKCARRAMRLHGHKAKHAIRTGEFAIA